MWWTVEATACLPATGDKSRTNAAEQAPEFADAERSPNSIGRRQQALTHKLSRKYPPPFSEGSGITGAYMATGFVHDARSIDLLWSATISRAFTYPDL